MTVWEMTASEMEQKLGSFCKRDFRVWRRQQWQLWWHSLLDCSSRMLRIWIASSSEDRSYSQGYKKQGKQSQTLFNALLLNGLPMRYKSFCYKGSFNPATNFTELRKRLQNFHKSTAQRHKGQSGSVALAVKHDFKKGPKKGKRFVCGISRHFAEDCRRKETAQCSKCGEKGQIDRECKRQRDGGKQESLAMGPTLASPDEGYWAALTQWKTAGMLVDSGCTDHIVTNIDAFLDFVPIQSVVRNPNGEAS